MSGWSRPRCRGPWLALVLVLAPASGLAAAPVPAGAPPARWTGGILLDDAARAVVRAPSAQARERAARASDVLLRTLIAWPLVVDALLVGGALRRLGAAPAARLFAASGLALALNGLVHTAVARTVGRERPYVQECARAPALPECGRGPRAGRLSFYSGHTSTAFTAATLTWRHTRLAGLYAPLAGGLLRAAVALAALAMALLRMASDRHYLSDVAVGALAGGACAWVGAWLVSAVARRGRAAGGLLGVALALAPAAARAEAGLRWDERWPRFGVPEALATLGLGLGTWGLAEVRNPRPAPGVTSGGVLFDTAVREHLRARSVESVQRARSASDTAWRLTLLGPPLLDVWVLALGVHRSPDVAGQLLLIGAQSYALTGAVTLVTQVVAKRQRPYVQDCDAQGRGPLQNCGGRRDRESFLSGHAASAMTSAMVSCLHHRRLALLGGGTPEVAWCGLLVGGAVSTGLLRIASDQHYASDVLAGWALGVVSGYVLPAWLHYGFGGRRTPAGAGLRWTLAPGAAGGALGLTARGSLP